MRIFILSFLLISSLCAEVISLNFKAMLSPAEFAQVRSFCNELRVKGEPALRTVRKKRYVQVIGGRQTLRSCAVNVPLSIMKRSRFAGKLSPIVTLNTPIFSPEEAIAASKQVIDQTGKECRFMIHNTIYKYTETTPKDQIFFADGSFKPEALRPYTKLSMSETDRQKTYDLIHKMGTLSWGSLLYRMRDMNKLGDDVDHVHPMRFIGYICGNDHLKSCLREVKGSSLKWTRFVDGFGGKMNKNFDANNLLKHIPGLCHETGANYDEVERLIQSRSWEALIGVLLK